MNPMFNPEARNDKRAENEWRRGLSPELTARDIAHLDEQIAQQEYALEEVVTAATKAFNQNPKEHEELIAKGQRITAALEALREQRAQFVKGINGGHTIQ
jgi:selenocysteine lyase/cysteine desulfurase